jgi:predicted nucleic acid-binding protein
MGLTVLDAGIIIGFLDSHDAHHPAANSALSDAQSRNDRLVLPASAFAEMLVAPSRKGAAEVAVVRRLVERIPIDIEPLGTGVAVAAAALRARHPSLKLPDALVIATASHLQADHLVTTDRHWPSSTKLKLATTIIEI